ncbi:PE-PGRS family protein [Mycobacterium tuberculosis]|nr:PE-PGRS family protein [Mycobacterium tuberculosis]
MSFVVAVPEALAAAASDVANIGSALSAANAAAAAGTTGLLAAGADEVSAALASLFSGHAVSYQQVAAQATALHDQFVQALTGAGGSYALTEAANVQQNLLNAINAPTQALLGRPLIGDGAVGPPAAPTGKMAVCCSATGAPATTAPPRPEWPAATAATPD